MNLSKELDYELSTTDIKKVLGKNTKIVKYSDLANLKSILDAFGNSNDCVLFDPIVSASNGHYECLFRNGNTITFFDSYGLPVDGFKKYVSSTQQLQKLHELRNYLSDLLIQAQNQGYIVNYNPFQYQKFANDITTCGDHVSCRLLHKNLNGLQYKNYLQSLMKQFNVNTYDDVVVILISKIIEK
jgi:hypothetical protein